MRKEIEKRLVAFAGGEAQGAESRNDFIHKTSIVLKELRETLVNLQIIDVTKLSREPELLAKALDESDQLVAIFQKTVMTARSRK